jgi:hypothetical protein
LNANEAVRHGAVQLNASKLKKVHPNEFKVSVVKVLLVYKLWLLLGGALGGFIVV